jgi:hypothetical protein
MTLRSSSRLFAALSFCVALIRAVPDPLNAGNGDIAGAPLAAVASQEAETEGAPPEAMQGTNDSPPTWQTRLDDVSGRVKPYKIVFLVFVFLGSVLTATNVLAFGDLMILGMAFPNLVGVYLLSGKLKRMLDQYWSAYRSGEYKIY